MINVCLYFKVFGLGEDKNGNLCYAGMKIDLGAAKRGVTYADLQKKLLDTPDWRKQVLEFSHLGDAGLKPENIDLISPEEYDQDYGDDEDVEES